MRQIIPRTMSTQHPDNVHRPFFAEHSVLGGEDEIQEAFYAYSHLGCDEQMWDFEGKEVDNYVVKKLLANNENFFREKKLGQDVRLTYRVPNPEVEHSDAKILLETLESIPRSFDAAKLFYNEPIAPIFEIIQPMTTSAESLNRIYNYYERFVSGKESEKVTSSSTVREWIGEFFPKTINVIPLFEDKEHILDADKILREYLKDKSVPYQRVFLARSDPAVNYGQIGAVLLNKIALQRLHKLEKELGIPIYPILGVGSAPFRGNLRPETVSHLLNGYPSVQTFTIQSSFKFDNPPDIVRHAIETINNTPRQAPMNVEEEKLLPIIEKYTAEYIRQLKLLVDPINAVARYIPKRRKRKLHTGLFGYSRNLGEMQLPRAITFTAALYSLGIPPELLGLNALTPGDIEEIKKCYANIVYDIGMSARLANVKSPFFPKELLSSLSQFTDEKDLNLPHKEMTDIIAKSIQEKPYADVSGEVLRAANIRGFLG